VCLVLTTVVWMLPSAYFSYTEWALGIDSSGNWQWKYDVCEFLRHCGQQSNVCVFFDVLSVGTQCLNASKVLSLEVSQVAQSVWCLITDRGSIPDRGRGFVLPAFASGPAVIPTQLPVQWVSGVLFPEVKHCRCVTLTTHPRLVPWLRKGRTYTSSPHKRFRGV
jgi:hypothetical protein